MSRGYKHGVFFNTVVGMNAANIVSGTPPADLDSLKVAGWECSCLHVMDSGQWRIVSPSLKAFFQKYRITSDYGAWTWSITLYDRRVAKTIRIQQLRERLAYRFMRRAFLGAPCWYEKLTGTVNIDRIICTIGTWQFKYYWLFIWDRGW